GERFAQRFDGASTVASGLRVPAAVADFMILDTVRASGGKAIAGRESSIADWMQRASSAEGISVCPQTAIPLHGLAVLRQTGDIPSDDGVVVFNTGAAQKYLEAFPIDLPRIDKTKPIDEQIGK